MVLSTDKILIMKEKHLYTILKVINLNLNVKQLTREGLSFPEISDLMANCIEKGYLIHTKTEVKLSENGIKKLIELENIFKKINKKDWIEKDNKSRIDKKDKNFIFVPRQTELTF